jgi:hypothetical protein
MKLTLNCSLVFPASAFATIVAGPEEPNVWFVHVPLHVPASVFGVKAVVAAPALQARKAAAATTTPKRTS